MAREAIVSELDLPYAPELVWAALADPASLARWLMPNDFRPVVGHRFTFTTDPVPPHFDGTIRCEVLVVEPPARLAYTWVSGELDTLVTFTLRPHDGGTRLRLEHSGFDTTRPGDRAALASLSQGWKSVGMAARLAAAIAG